MRTHRFYIHTADPRLEAGYNMASAEAMAAGMPVLTNQHPTSLIKNGRSGFVSDDPNKLREYARILLQDKDLAAEMGGHARKTIIEQLPIAGFKNAFTKSIEIARRKWQNRLLRTFTPAY